MTYPGLMNSDAAEPVRLSVIIPALNAAAVLAATLQALAEDGASDLDLETIVSDGGSTDGTTEIARDHGARVISAERGRGLQLHEGATRAGGDTLLFLHADTRLSEGWRAAAATFASDPANQGKAGFFRFVLDDDAPEARRLERIVSWRCRRFGLPYGDQGLLLSRTLYAQVGGYRPMPLMEDVDLVRRIGRNRMLQLPADAVTSAARYRRDGYLARSARNLFCLSLYGLGLPPRVLTRIYG